MKNILFIFATILLLLVSSAPSDEFVKINLSKAKNKDWIISVFKYGAKLIVQKAAKNNDIEKFSFSATLYDAWERKTNSSRYYKFNSTLDNNDGVIIRTAFTVKVSGKEEDKKLWQWKYVINVNPNDDGEDDYVPLDPSDYQSELVQGILVESVRDIILNNQKIPRTTYKLKNVESVEKKDLGNGLANYRFKSEFESLDGKLGLKVRAVVQYESETEESKVLSYKWVLNSSTK